VNVINTLDTKSDVSVLTRAPAGHAGATAADLSTSAPYDDGRGVLSTATPLSISIFGAGYVGAVSAACLANDGHCVIAVDPSAEKVDAINRGVAPLLEPGLSERIEAGVRGGRLHATHHADEAVRDSDISFVCVGTPSRPNGSLDIGYCVKVAHEIGLAIRRKRAWHSVVFRSTILPGTMDKHIIPALEVSSGLKAGVDFGVAYYPEFLRESSAIKDHYGSEVIVFGKKDERTIDLLRKVVAGLPAEPTVLSIAEAEAIKYTNNCWHALKVSFANEIGAICKAAGIDSHVVMSVLCADKRLNISPVYLRPGFAFGGSCLPKDVRALRHFGREHEVETPLLDATLEVNSYQIDRAVQWVMTKPGRKVTLLGLSFKPQTDDLRESPYVTLAERLIGKGYDVKIHDPDLNNRLEDTILSRMPHLRDRLVEDCDEACAGSDMVIVCKQIVTADWVANTARDTPLLDLERISPKFSAGGKYVGFSW
jgi:GDP-mannose 6-dehydrogenase